MPACTPVSNGPELVRTETCDGNLQDLSDLCDKGWPGINAHSNNHRDKQGGEVDKMSKRKT